MPLSVREDIAYFVEAETEFGQAPDSGEQDGFPHAVVAVPVAASFGFR